MRILAIGFLLLCLVYAVLGALVYFNQDHLLFKPQRPPASELEQRAEALGFSPWFNAQGEQIGWQSKDGNPEDVLLVFSGNGGFALFCSFYRERAKKAEGDWKTYLLEYPGYGSRAGQPSEQSLTKAGIEAVDTLAAVPGRKIWLLGLSLGSGVASATARERPNAISGIILVTPFNSMVDTAAYHYPWFTVRALMKNRFESEKNLKNYPGPVAFLVSANDTTTPAMLGKKLYDGYPGIKQLWIDPHGDHEVTALENAEWNRITAWVRGNALADMP